MSSEAKKVSVSPGVFTKLGADFRARTAEARLYTTSLKSLTAEATLARTIGRFAASVKDVVVRRGLDRKFLATQGGRELVAEVYASVARRMGLDNDTVNKIRGLAGSTSNAKEFYKSLSETLKDHPEVLKAGRNVLASFLMKAVVVKGKEGIAVIDASSARAYVVGEKGTTILSIEKEEIANKLRKEGFDEKRVAELLANERMTRTMMLEVLEGRLRDMGFKVSKTFVADAVLSDIVKESAIEAQATGAKFSEVFESKLNKELATNQLFARRFEEKAMVELKRSLNMGAAVEAFNKVLGEVSILMPKMATRMLAVVMRYIPVVGVVASVSAEATEMAISIGEGIKKTVEETGKKVSKISSKLSEVLPESTVKELMIKPPTPSDTVKEQATVAQTV